MMIEGETSRRPELASQVSLADASSELFDIQIMQVRGAIRKTSLTDSK